MPEPIFMKLGMYIVAPEPITTAYSINPSHQSVCLYVYPLPVLGNGSVDMFPQGEKTFLYFVAGAKPTSNTMVSSRAERDTPEGRECCPGIAKGE
jgi:hypothetical protein